jgi:hypothetical protein
MPDKRRSTPAYARWRKQVLAQCEPVCIRCGYPVDMDLPSTHPDGPTADHEPPLAETDQATPDMTGAGIAHLSCNRSHGGRLGSSRMKRNAPNKKTAQRGPDPVFRVGLEAPLAPLPVLPPNRQNQTEPNLVQPKLDQGGHVRPRLETAPRGDSEGTHGPAAAVWLREVYGMTLRPWQAYALDRALEYDKDGLIWASVIITVGRQSGKSWLSRAVCMWRLHNAELFGEPQTIIHVANKRETAMEVIRPAMQWAVETYGNKAARWGNTMAGINLPTGDRWIIHAANESAGVGYSAGMVFADEAWKIERRVIEDSLAPTMAERNQPQLWLVSTAGDSSSELMLTARARAIDNLDTPTSELLLEWSAPPDADPDLVSTWQWGSPDWSEKREKFLRQQWERIDPGAFKREYLNQWIVKDNHWMGSGVWDTCEDPTLVLDVNQHWAVACESDFDGTSHAVAIAWVTGENLIAVKVTTHRTIKDVDERLAEIRAINPDLHVAITPSYIDRLTSHTDAIVGQREAQIATQVMLDAFNRCTIRHDGDPALLDQFTRSTISKRSGGWVLSSVAGSGGVYAARAVMFALAQITKQPKPRPMIYSRSATRR